MSRYRLFATDDSAAGNKPAPGGIQYGVFLTARWFPLILALLQTVRHVGLVGYDYWAAAQHESRFNVEEFFRRDLARPIFEPSGFCGAWTSYGFGQTAVIGLDLPAYAWATLVHSAINWRNACEETFTTPRGQIIVAVFVLPLWFLVGLSIRRLAQRRWRRRTTGRISRILVTLGLIGLPFGLLGLLFSVVSMFVSGDGQALGMAGMACWMLYLAALAAERLRVWPFELKPQSPPSKLR
jgi:hypothetical protein